MDEKHTMNDNRYTRVSPIRGTLNTHIRNQEVTKDDIFDRLVSLRKPAQKLFTRIKSTYDYKSYMTWSTNFTQPS